MDSKSSENSKNVLHQPEFVFVGDEYIDSQNKAESHQDEFYQSFRKLHEIKPTISVRLACFFSSLLIFIASLFMAVCVLLNIILVVGTLGLNQSCKIVLVKNWVRFKTFFVISGGMLIGAFSPIFGLGIIILYFLLQGQGSHSFFTSFMESSVHTK